MIRLVFVLLLLAGCNSRQPAPLVLVSLDGFRADYLDRGITPALARLAREGVRAEALIPAFPTKTFPNHYTLVTGLRPARHGIVGNEFTDPELGRFSLHDRRAVRDARFWGGVPIWVVAERSGLRTAPVFWPGSEAPIDGIRPARWMPYDHGLPDTARVRQVLDLLDLPAERRPAFLTLYLNGVDDAGHHFGPHAPETDRAIARADSMIGLLLAGLAQRGVAGSASVVVVSDHGMAATSPGRTVFLDDYVDSARLEVDALSPVLTAHPRPGWEDSIYLALRRAPHLSVYRRESLPTALHLAESPRVAPIVAIADEGWTIAWRGDGGTGGGEHGYLDTLASMRALFVARGPKFRRGLVVPPFRNIHLYPLLAELLGLSAPPSDGSLDSVRAMLATDGSAEH